MLSVYAFGLASGFLVAVIFYVLLEGAHAAAERERRILIARRRAEGRARAQAE